MKKLLYAALAFLVVNTAVAQKKVDIKSLEKYIQESLVKFGVPGMAVAIVKDDSVVLSKGFGKRVYNEDKLVDDKTIFAIASNTKAFTAAALGILQEEGKLSIDNKVTDYIPYFEMKDAYASKEMTVRDLLCHRSGLETFSGDLMWYGTGYSREQVIKSIRYLQPKYSFRSKYGYQNLMFITAGEIVPAVSGEPFDKFLKDRFLKPLGMNNTTTSIKDFKNYNNIAMPHTKAYGTGALDSVYYKDWDNMGGAGNINSCVSDMAKWIKLLLNKGKLNGKQIISEKYLREMMTSQTVIGVSEAGEKFIPGRHFVDYGLGFKVYDYKGVKVVQHGGGADGMISGVILVPEMNLGFVILTNSINSLPSALEYKILDVFMGDNKTDWAQKFHDRIKAGEEQEKIEHKNLMDSQVKNTKPSLDLNKYAGIYTGKMYGDAEIKVKGDKLEIDLKPTSTFKGTLTHWHYDTFRVRLKDKNLPDGFVKFILDNNGNVSEFIIDIPNPDFDFTELEFRKK